MLKELREGILFYFDGFASLVTLLILIRENVDFIVPNWPNFNNFISFNIFANYKLQHLLFLFLDASRFLMMKVIEKTPEAGFFSSCIRNEAYLHKIKNSFLLVVVPLCRPPRKYKTAFSLCNEPYTKCCFNVSPSPSYFSLFLRLLAHL